jgi:glycosyltransferase involved in cell wall biosynthesis
MRITFVVGTLALGGVERLVTDWCRLLSGKHECSVICLLGKRGAFVPALEEMGVRVVDFSCSPHHPRFVFDLAKVLRGLNSEVFHSQCSWSLPQQVMAARLGGNTAFILTFHSIYGSPSIASRLRQWAGLNVVRRGIKRFVGVSEAVTTHASRRLRLRGGQITTIHNGIDTTLFSPSEQVRDATRNRLKFDDKVVIGLAVGGLSRQKDHVTLLRGIRRFVSGNPGRDIVLLVVGEGPEHSKLVSLTKALALEPYVRLIGARHDVPELMAAADVFLHTATREGFGLAVAEAHAAGLPVVAADVGGVGEIVRDGISGILFPAGDPAAMARSMEKVLNAPDQGKAMGLRGREWVTANFEIEKCTERYEQLYYEVMSA